MSGEILALLVHDRPMPMEPLRSALEGLSIATISLRTCGELRSIMGEVHADLIFTDIFLSDGSWEDVVKLVRGSGAPASVVVVGPHQDVRLYLSVMEGGAFDFILPPFERNALEFVVYSALDNTRIRRKMSVVHAPLSVAAAATSHGREQLTTDH